MTKKIVLITVFITVVSFGLSISLAQHYGEENMVQYLQNVANHTFSQKSYEGKMTQESLDAEKVNELEITSTGVDIKVEKSTDSKVKLMYNKTPDDKISELIHINGLTMKLNLDELQNHGSYVQFNFTKNENHYGMIFKEPSVVISVPENIKKVKVKSVSGDITIIDLSVDSLKVQSVSGNVHVESPTLNEFEGDSVSGDIELFGSVKGIKAKTISGNLNLESKLNNPNLKFISTSGDLTAHFEKEPSINLKFETVSGDISFPSELNQAKVEGSTQQIAFGKGEGLFEVQTTSGNIEFSGY